MKLKTFPYHMFSMPWSSQMHWGKENSPLLNITIWMRNYLSTSRCECNLVTQSSYQGCGQGGFFFKKIWQSVICIQTMSHIPKQLTFKTWLHIQSQILCKCSTPLGQDPSRTFQEADSSISSFFLNPSRECMYNYTFYKIKYHTTLSVIWDIRYVLFRD